LELQQQLQRLEEIIVLDGLKIPLTQRTIVDEEQLLSQLLAVERSIPDTIRSAETILQNKEEIISRANQCAEDLIQSAERRAAQIADELTISQQAELQAQHLLKQVQSEVETIRQRNTSEVERVRRQTQQEIDAMRQAAQAECKQIQQEADRYVEQVLKDLEDRLGHMTRVVQNGRSHLQNSAG
jgi:F0F1-type ATP synthase membrane subunit b/b'